jgi:hypothetical protein
MMGLWWCACYWRHAAVPGVDLLRARFLTHRYTRHAHETFSLGLVEEGLPARYGSPKIFGRQPS